jgi:hypothetical protein
MNLDLRFEKGVLQQQIDEKDNLLKDAYVAVDKLEQEQQSFIAHIEELKNMASSAASLEDSQHRYTEDDVGRESLLMEAFGSMNLAPHPEDVAALKVKISSLEGELNIEQDHGNDMKNMLEEKSVTIGKCFLMLQFLS